VIGKVVLFLLALLIFAGIFVYSQGWDAFADPLITFWNGIHK
jgi:hypothetical protein